MSDAILKHLADVIDSLRERHGENDLEELFFGLISQHDGQRPLVISH